MRILALASLPVLAALAVGTASAPARAQAYNPNFPVCMQVFGLANYLECRFASMQQCAASASGRAAQCLPNPYFANASEGAATRHHRRAYRDY